MAKKTVYIPFYEDGAYHWMAVTGEVQLTAVAEGLPAIKPSSCDVTPPERLQAAYYKPKRE